MTHISVKGSFQLLQLCLRSFARAEINEGKEGDALCERSMQWMRQRTDGNGLMDVIT